TGATAAAFAVALFIGCSSTTPVGFGADGNGNSSGQSTGGSGVDPSKCPLCVSDSDCNGGICAQFGSDIFCAPSCAGGASCSSDRTCSLETSASGDQVSVCVPNDDACGNAGGGSGGGTNTCAPSGGGDDAGDPNRCGSFVGPAETASCTSCSGSSSKCQANGCYGGWWCDTSTNKCQSSPSGCTPGGGGGGGSTGTTNCSFDAGTTPITGTIGVSGGTASRLYFGIVGDTRPANIDGTSGYPTTIINKIYADIAGLSPQPLFVVTTGDYMFAAPGHGTAGPQMDLYLTAQKQFKGTAFAAMGNHECTGATNSNCATSTTENFNVFMSQMLAPLGVTKPYYAVTINATDNSWTSKLVFIAANAWDSTQSSWLDTTLGQATTYTFILRHEPTEANTAPGVTPSDAIIRKHPYTLLITGHTHNYSHNTSNPREIVVGIGGAPLTGTSNYGFGLAQQRSDGTIQVYVLDYQSLNFDPSFRFAVHPDGSSAPL
ncbi:MAG: metallophosphoesterase, partial [Polyangiaceae bacterium]